VPAPRILLVDDQRDITRMLRAALETLGGSFEIIDVHSAEEALVEFGRGPVDLLITDLRLPGITGFELVKRVRATASQTALFVISAYADGRTQSECRRLGATFFAKPLSLDTFLRAVDGLFGRDSLILAPQVTPPAEIAGAADRLARLRSDLGAASVYLLDPDGKIAARAGDAADADIQPALAPLMAAFSASLRVSQLLGRSAPANIQYFDGQGYGIYVANVGSAFALTIVLRTDRSAAAMGPVMHYGRQCVDDLLTALRSAGESAPPAPSESRPSTPKGAAPGAPDDGPASGRGEKPAAPYANDAVVTEPAAPSAAAELDAGRALASAGDLAPEEAARLDAAATQTDAAAAALFWDHAAGSTDLGDVRSDTISWEQAARLGLLPPEK
jgi:CheY-like chemotaxis protein